MTVTGRDTDRNGGSGDRALAERGRAVDAAILAIEKQFGRGSIMRLGSAERQQVEAIPTGSMPRIGTLAAESGADFFGRSMMT